MWAPVVLGCSVSGFEERYRVQDEEIEEIIEETPYSDDLQKRDYSYRKTRSRYKSPESESEEEQTKKLTLKGSFQLALDNNRELLNRIEDAALARIDAEVEEHRYHPVIQPVTFSHTRSGSQFSERNVRREEVEMSVQQRLPYGGNLESGVRLRNDHGNQALSRGSTVRPFLSMDLPLLRDAGLITAQNDLVNAARSRRYARRELRDFKQKFLIEIVERFFSILQQKRTIQNFESQLSSSEALLEQSNIQFNSGNISKVDLFRAEFQETESKRDLQIERERLKLTRDAFKIELNLSLQKEVKLADQQINFEREEISEEEYIQKVLDHNLLWKNEKAQYEDARRRLKVAYNQTLPELDFEGDIERIEGGETAFRDLQVQDTDWTMGLSLELPIDQTFLNRDLHEAIINFQRAERNLALARDELIQETREDIIQVRQSRFNVEASRQAVEQARKALELLNQQYQQGEVTNRDVIEEQNNLIRSQNNLLQALVNWKVNRLELKQKAGELSVENFQDWLRYID